MDIKARTFFQIRPTEDNPNRVVLCNQGFDLNTIRIITEPMMASKLSYVFHVWVGYTQDSKLEFEFEMKRDAVSCQRELTRAWAGVEEFSQEKLKGTNNV